MNLTAMSQVSVELYNHLNTCADQEALEAYRLIFGETDLYKRAKEEFDETTTEG